MCKQTKSQLVHVGVRENPSREVYECGGCGSHFLTPPFPDQKEYYRNQYRKEHSNKIGSELVSAEQFKLMRPLMDMRTELFKRTIPVGAKVLEVGCASGFFLDTIKDDYTCYGTDFNPDDAAYVRDVLNLPCDEEDLEECFPGEQFTVICAFHVLEHLPDPVGWLRKAKERLIGGGWIYVEVPNLINALLALYQIPEFQTFFYREPHVSYFTMYALAEMMGNLGFEARVTQRQDYSFYNNLHWLMTGQPQADAQVARNPLMPVPEGHPAAEVVNRWFVRVNREYMTMLDTMKAGDTLIGLARKREI